ncbi:hypothetical protein RND81_13G059400 [Saponaria officinalis]|uniref:RING-type E3 ubiquitin transferase n=1 Tax=Saponaria officinalis TaxID=3572 RepID=A0AAW1H4E7_SAPOF
MGRHEDATITNTGVYPQELQLKLYQAFIFSIPILFCIILLLLLYLFYLKRRATAAHLLSSASHHPSLQISASTHHSISPPWNIGIKVDLKDKLQVVHFDEELQARDSLCCVCLGEFEMKEELRQLPLCKHVFHGDCIRHWLRASATCPLCRCPLISAINVGQPIRLMPNLAHQINNNPAQHEIWTATTSDVHNSSTPQHHVIHLSI